MFFEQDNKYQEEVLSLGCSNRVSIEAGTTLGWQKFIGMSGLAIGLDHFGASAPAKRLAEEYGFTPEKVSEKIKKFFSSRS